MNTISVDDLRKLGGGGVSKYRNTRTDYNGTVYDSKKEAMYRQQLDMLTGANIPDHERVALIEEQVRYPIVINDVKICSYVLDFKVTYGDGHVDHVDVKGMKTQVYKLKKKMMLAVHGIEIVEV